MKILITGGCGFIGCNAAKRFLDAGHHVVVLDNLSRHGSADNLEWLREQEGTLTFLMCDVRDYRSLRAIFAEHQNVDAVLHLAAQVAVTTSVTNPREDFEINLVGTFNLLEALRETYRERAGEVLVIYASTNKVYGGMEDAAVVERNNRYEFRDFPRGIPETRGLDFHSPYGCSKGGADQYVRDYSRIYKLKTVCFRQSCIYGYRQFGVEDQGWVAWFTIAAFMDKKITIYGDGKQVRDVLFVEDLVDAYELAIEHTDVVSGQCYNVGGGPENQLSLLELIAQLESLLGRKLKYTFDASRPGDQAVYVSDIAKISRDLNWSPRYPVTVGVQMLSEWVQNHERLFVGDADAVLLGSR